MNLERAWRVAALAWLPVAAGLAAGVLVAMDPRLALLALGGFAAVYTCVRWPPAMVGLIFLAMLFDRAGVTGMKLAAFPVTGAKLSVLGGIGMWVLHVMLTDAPPVRFHRVQMALGVFILTTLLSVVHANGLEAGKFTLFGLVMMLVLVSLVFSALAEARLDGLYRFFSVILVVAILASLRGAGVVSEAGRASGTLGDANEWATILLLVGFFVIGHLANDESRAGVILRWAVLGLVPLGLLRSESRASLLVLAICAPGLWLLLRHHRRQLGAIGLVGLFAAPLVLDLDRAWGRVQNLILRLQGVSSGDRDPSLDERTELFRQGVQLFKDNWFLGAGAGRFEVATGFISPTGELRPAHNTYLEVASEQGIVGLAGLFLFGGTVLVCFWNAWHRAPDAQRRGRVMGAALSMSSVALMGATLGLITFSIAWLLLGVSLAVMVQAEAPHASSV
jgi:O-antigen ligase